MKPTVPFPVHRCRRLALVPASVLLLAACGAGLRVDTDYDPEASFDNMGRYDWADSTDILGEFTAESPFLERRIWRAVDETLNERGFVRETVGEVDFLVTAFVVAASQDRVAQVSPAVSVSFGVGFGYYPFAYYPAGYYRYHYGFGSPWYRYPYGYGRYGWGYAPGRGVGVGTAWVPAYGLPGGATPGTLVVDIFDAATGELIWRGWATRAVAELPYRDDAQEFLNETVGKILQGFPPETPDQD
jgi:hypothetical protein